MVASNMFRLSACLLLLVVYPPGFDAQMYPSTSSYWSTQQYFSTTGKTDSYNCGRNIFNGTMGNITSPNYPSSYENFQLCTYFIVAPSLSTINVTIFVANIEPQIYCVFDWVEFTCQSNSISRTIRYCGANNRWNVSFKPCSRVIMRFVSDGSAVGQGFFASYTIKPISCQGNCTPVAIGAGYNCTCDANQTTFVPPPYDQCPADCYLSSNFVSNSSQYCTCLGSPNTTTSTPNYPTPSVPSCPYGCYPSFDRFGYPVCNCNTTFSSTTPPIECPYGCYVGQDSYGYPICRCEGTTRSSPCPYGCYNVTYYTGYSYCECSSPQSVTPLTVTCPSGCTPDTDYWNTPYCRCNQSNPTTPSYPTNPPSCNYPCYYRYLDYGGQYCECNIDNRTSNATDAPCNYPCYYNYDNYNRRYCSCGLSTTVAPCYSPCRYDYDYYGRQYCNCNSTTNCNYPCYNSYDSNWNTVCICNASSTVASCSYPCRYDYDYYGRQYCNCNSTTSATCNYPCYYSYDSNWNTVCICNASTTAASCSYPCRYDYDYYGRQYCNCNSTTSATCNYPCYYSYDSNWNTVCICNASTTAASCSYPCRYDYDYYGRQYCNCNSTTSRPTTCSYPCYYGYDSYYNTVCLCNASTTAQPPTLPPGCNVTMNSSVGTLMSPNYPNAYPASIDCVQTITVPMANSFQLTFTDLALFFTSNDSCVYEWVEITGCDGSVQQYCSSASVNVPIEFICSRSYNLTVLFHSYSYNFYNRGFKLNYRTTFGSSCNSTGGLVSLGDRGIIVSPSYPESYPLSNDCYYVLQAEERQAMRIRVAFELLMMQETLACSMEFIKMNCLDGSGNTKYICGTRIPSPVTFNCSSVEIQFHSETPPSAAGRSPRLFKIIYYGIEGVSACANSTHPLTDALVSSAFSLHSRLGSSGAGGAGSVLLVVLFVTWAMKTSG